MNAEYESVALSGRHDVASFDCGVSSLNAWLAEQAPRAQQAGTARTFVWVSDETPQTVWAYFSLVPTEVARDILSRSQSSGYTTVSGYLLARLAVHADLRGLGYDFTPLKGNPRRLVLKMANLHKLPG